MRYSLAQLTKRTRKTRRKEIVFRPILPAAMLATDLYASAYAPVIRAWQDAIPAIMAQYERSLSGMTTDSPEEIGAVISSVESDFLRIVLTIRLRLEQWGLRVEKWQSGRWRGAVLSATGVDVSTLIGAGDMRDTLATAIERNVSLVKSVSDQTRTRIADSVFRGLSQRRPPREVGKEISETVGMSRKRANRIAADQNVKITAALNDERRREAGVMGWEWMHSGKLHPREEHKARDGKRYSDDPADKAPPPATRPGEEPYCGCTSLAVLDLTGEF